MKSALQWVRSSPKELQGGRDTLIRNLTILFAQMIVSAYVFVCVNLCVCFDFTQMAHSQEYTFILCLFSLEQL